MRGRSSRPGRSSKPWGSTELTLDEILDEEPIGERVPLFGFDSEYERGYSCFEVLTLTDLLIGFSAWYIINWLKARSFASSRLESFSVASELGSGGSLIVGWGQVAERAGLLGHGRWRSVLFSPTILNITGLYCRFLIFLVLLSL